MFKLSTQVLNVSLDPTSESGQTSLRLRPVETGTLISVN